ncbi:homocysteine S-methyltransferase family protein [Lichenihabitans sp. Uapishka_5]|uniref:homocysteine S-methyltransferase family protein n=1 Tax=Lichenihabitans sp. Uapishka_5 TaxID=3037302 RepID=UPI0029E7D866|nr:homocysteine S-methyltransferase family protein [Lichenihabitans sp. Uapishka_5]MDX7952689.1 homocysteine S-methyltransferase family protein [Lichenihabitans sp. Uapishka_5]
MSETATPPLLILDGGMSRELVAFGAELRQPEWSALALMESPDIVERVHRAFIAAGADIVTTNSYALVPFHIGDDRFRTDAAILADRAGRLARQAADVAGRPVLVAGSLPPLFGSYEPQKFEAAEAPKRLAVLVPALAPHVDLWLGETLSLIAEAEAVCAAVAATAKPVWISFTLDDATNDGPPRLRSGEDVAAAAEWLAGRSTAAALLFNCSHPEVMAAAVETARPILDRIRPGIRLGVYANAFAANDDDGAANETLSAVRQDLGPERYVAVAADWVAAGASVVGGCCGIGCGHIEALSRRFALRGRGAQ